MPATAESRPVRSGAATATRGGSSTTMGRPFSRTSAIISLWGSVSQLGPALVGWPSR